MMGNRWTWLRLLLVCCAIGSTTGASARQASSAEQYAGAWSGTYDGAGTGPFEMTLDKGKDGAMTGRVAVTTDAGNYTADFKTVSFDGARMSATYDYPLDPAAEVVMTTTFDGRSAKGTWVLRAKGQTDEVASGTLTVTRK
jgi:hypothetical protein